MSHVSLCGSWAPGAPDRGRPRTDRARESLGFTLTRYRMDRREYRDRHTTHMGHNAVYTFLGLYSYTAPRTYRLRQRPAISVPSTQPQAARYALTPARTRVHATDYHDACYSPLPRPPCYPRDKHRETTGASGRSCPRWYVLGIQERSVPLSVLPRCGDRAVQSGCPWLPSLQAPIATRRSPHARRSAGVNVVLPRVRV